MPDRIGQQVGKYRLLRLLGRGGFAEVYLGEHISLKSLAAIKVLSTQLKGEEVDIFLKEARTIARLDHPHIVRILDFEVQEGTPFLVISYLPHGSLRERHPRGSLLSLPTMVNYVKQIADALQYAHDEKVIHRDVKPENMLVGRRNEVVLSDFGIAIAAQSSRYQHTQDIAGTITYMAPEQIQGHPRPASDQYALGIVVYEWLTGERPFHGTALEIATQHLTTLPRPLREKMPQLTSAVEEVVLTALAKDVKQRFGSVQAFATALEQASQMAGGLATPSPPPAHSTPMPMPPLPGQNSPWLTEEDPPKPIAAGTPPPLTHLLSSSLHTLPGTMSGRSNNPEPGPRPLGTLWAKLLVGIVIIALLASSGVAVSLFSRHSLSFTAAGPRATPSPTHSPLPTTPVTSPAAASVVYIGSGSGTIYALRTGDGSVLWSHQVGAGVASKPAIVGGVVYVGSDDGYLYALAASDGHLLWRFRTGNKVDDKPAVVGGIIYFGSWDDTVYAVRATTGALVWRYQTGGFIFSSPIIINNLVYIGSADSYVYALKQENGALVWRYKTGGMVDATPAVADGVLYIGSWDQDLYALRANDGIFLWRYQTGLRVSANMPTVVNGIVYFGSSDGFVYALKVVDGTFLWRYQTRNHVSCSPAVVNGILYICSDDSFIYALRTSNGTLLWSFQTGGTVGWALPIVNNGLVYVGSADGFLYALHASDGTLFWRTSIGGNGQIPSPPNIGP